MLRVSFKKNIKQKTNKSKQSKKSTMMTTMKTQSTCGKNSRKDTEKNIKYKKGSIKFVENNKEEVSK